MTDIEITQGHIAYWNDGYPLRMIFDDRNFERIKGNNVLNRIDRPLDFMKELWELSAPAAVASFQVPHGASEVAWEDPRNKRPMFHGSFGIFSRPAHENTPELKYSADWRCENISFAITKEIVQNRPLEQVMEGVMVLRNQVDTMIALLVAVKPAREAKMELLEKPEIEVIQT